MEKSDNQVIDVPALLQRHAQTTVECLRRALEHHDSAPRGLIEAIEYSLFAGGKRLRPALLLESYQACSPDAVDASETARAAAAAMELIHTFSLVHDDLPAMDDDDLRRGKPTNHKVFGEAMAILAGDAMITMAFDLLARNASPTLVPVLVHELASASGAAGMIGGQVLDMAGEKQPLTLDQLQQIHRMKTGALLRTSCRMGAIAAGADESMLQALTAYGQHVGIAFQIADDLLDVTSTPEQLGKATHKDRNRGKKTYPALLGVPASRTEASEHVAAALGALEGLGSRAEGLRALARFVVERSV